jgi:hypothetical protein
MKSRKHKFKKIKKNSQYSRNVDNRDLNDVSHESTSNAAIKFHIDFGNTCFPGNYAYKVKTSLNTNESSESLKDDAPHNEACIS